MIVEELAATLGLEVESAGFTQAAQLFASLRKGLLGFGTAATAAVVGLAAIAKGTAESGDKMLKLSQSVGVSSDALQELAYAAELSDVSTEELSQAMGHLAKGGAKDVQQALFDLADQFQSMPDGGEKTALAMEKLGRAGKTLIPLLNGGSGALRDAGLEARAFGLVMSHESLVASEKFNDELTRLNGALTGFRNRIGLKLIGPLSSLAEKFTDWVAKVLNSEESLKKLERGARLVAATLSGVLITQLYAAAAAAVVAAGGVAAFTAAFTTAALRMGLIGLVFVALGLVIEDLYVMLTGGKSVIGEWLVDWKELVDSLNTSDPGDHWLLRMLKSVKVALSEVESAWLRIKDSFVVEKGSVMDFLIRTVSGTAGESAVPTQNHSSAFGGGAAPLQSVMSSPSANNRSVVAPNVTTNVTVNSAPGMDEDALVSKMQTSIDRSHEAQMRSLAASVE